MMPKMRILDRVRKDQGKGILSDDKSGTKLFPVFIGKSTGNYNSG